LKNEQQKSGRNNKGKENHKMGGIRKKNRFQPNKRFSKYNTTAAKFTGEAMKRGQKKL